MNEVAVRMVCEYMHELENDTRRNPDCNDYGIMAWAAGEILEAILNRPDTPAVITVEEFMVKMDLFHYAAENPHNRIMFELARDTADEIGSMLI